jgi:hypothetical protein
VQRKADTLAVLRAEVDCWVASADEMGNAAHLVPVCASIPQLPWSVRLRCPLPSAFIT